jgi:hypothetical protein
MTDAMHTLSIGASAHPLASPAPLSGGTPRLLIRPHRGERDDRRLVRHGSVPFVAAVELRDDAQRAV